MAKCKPAPSWNKLLINAGLSTFSDQLCRRARPRYRLEDCAQERKHLIGGSRIGGCPDLPAEFVWPTEGDRYLTFLAQINLTELHSGFVPELPTEGWLHFFLGVDEPAWNVNHRVIYFPPSQPKLAKREPPAGKQPINDNRSFQPFSVTWEAGYSVSADDRVWNEIGQDPCGAALGVLYTEDTQIGGWALSFAGDPAEDAYLCKNGFEPILFDSHITVEELEQAIEENRRLGQSWRADRLESVPRELLAEFRRDVDAHRRAMEKWRPLFILGSGADMCWWDAGFLQFMIQDDDLAMTEFGNTYCCVTST